MAQVVSAPAPLDLQIVAGNPFTLAVSAVFEDQFGNAVSWADITEWAVSVGPVPEITSPSAGLLNVAWTAAQTAVLGVPGRPWSLSCFVSDVGPYAIVGGNLAATPPTQPGSSSGPAALGTYAVGLGTVTVTAGAWSV